jgi:hypothetical protein
MRFWTIALSLTLIAGVLAGCGGGEEASGSTEEQAAPAQAVEESAGDEGYTSEVLVISYEGALPASSQLVLGIFELQGTDNTITPEQAKALLPLWQALQGDALQGDAETNAVLKQIEGALTSEQLEAIIAMQLTREDLGAWMQEQGVNLGPPPGAQGGQGGLGDLSDEDRASRRATRQAGGAGGFGQGGFANLSEEERASMRATAEASGMTFGNRQGGARRGQLASLAEPLIELLTEIAQQ